MSNAASQLDLNAAVSVGRVVGVHGRHGELKIQPLTDFPERFQTVGSRFLGHPIPTVTVVELDAPGGDTRTAPTLHAARR